MCCTPTVAGFGLLGDGEVILSHVRRPILAGAPICGSSPETPDDKGLKARICLAVTSLTFRPRHARRRNTVRPPPTRKALVAQLGDEGSAPPQFRGVGRGRTTCDTRTRPWLSLKEGIHPRIVQERLGHSTVSITLDIYSHVLPTMQENAAAKIGAAVFGPRADRQK